MTQTINMNDAQRDFGRLVGKVSKKETRVVVEENGKQVAAIVSPSDLQRLNQLDQRREDLWKVFDEIHARNADKDPEEVERDVAEAIAEVREEERRKTTLPPK